MGDDYYRLIKRKEFKGGSWQAKSWRYGTGGINWHQPGEIPNPTKTRTTIKRIVLSYKAVYTTTQGKRLVIGRLNTKHNIHSRCIIDTPDELRSALISAFDLEYAAKKRDSAGSGRVKNILKCMVIYEDGSTRCFTGVDKLHKYFGGMIS